MILFWCAVSLIQSRQTLFQRAFTSFRGEPRLDYVKHSNVPLTTILSIVLITDRKSISVLPEVRYYYRYDGEPIVHYVDGCGQLGLPRRARRCWRQRRHGVVQWRG
jgi:hypothetical protein